MTRDRSLVGDATISFFHEKVKWLGCVQAWAVFHDKTVDREIGVPSGKTGFQLDWRALPWDFASG